MLVKAAVLEPYLTTTVIEVRQCSKGRDCLHQSSANSQGILLKAAGAAKWVSSSCISVCCWGFHAWLLALEGKLVMKCLLRGSCTKLLLSTQISGLYLKAVFIFKLILLPWRLWRNLRRRKWGGFSPHSIIHGMPWRRLGASIHAPVWALASKTCAATAKGNSSPGFQREGWICC